MRKKLSADIVTMDFETRSACDLKKTGPWVYAQHPTTQIMCLAYRINKEKPRLWHMAHPKLGIAESLPPKKLFAAIKTGALVECHNAFFERSIWVNICVKKMGWPKIDHDQWRCTAALAASRSLPRALEKAVKVMHLPIEKDMEGNRLMMKMSKPRKRTAKEIKQLKALGMDWESLSWHENVKDCRRLWNYCVKDVLAECALSDRLGHLNKRELKIWKLDQAINERGIYCDREMAKSALVLAGKTAALLNKELEEITDIPKASRRAQIKQWLSEKEGIDLPDTKGETLDLYLKDPEISKTISKRAKRVIKIVRSVNRTSTAKYQAMILRMSNDNRIRDTVMYFGAHSGRWSGKGVQPHNFPRGNIKNMEEACALILEEEPNSAYIQCIYGDVMEHLSFSLRGALTAAPGYELYTADFAAIEARVVFWLARAHSALRIFERGDDIYCDFAKTIYRRTIDKEKDPNERQMGKQSILGLGFGMGFCKFLITLRKYNISFTRAEVEKIVPDYHKIKAWVLKEGKAQVSKAKDLNLTSDLPELVLCKYVVDVYRKTYVEIPSLWKAQESAAIAAVLSPGRRVSCGLVSWWVEDDFLICKLPSGRYLYYRQPRVSIQKNQWGGEKQTLSYMGVDSDTKKWGRVFTYGGKLVENIVQGIARDLMAWAMLRIDRTGVYKLVLTVHDELIAEAKKGLGNIAEYARIIKKVPKWAKGCPIDCDAKVMHRYKK